MKKYKKGLVEEIKKEQAFDKKQGLLKEKYKVNHTGEKVIIVEKNNAYKFTIKTITALLKTIVTAIILILAIIGLTTLIYPTVRSEFFVIIQSIQNQIIQMIN